LSNSSISLVYSATVISFTTNIQTVALSANIIGSNVSTQISGWGSSAQTGGVPANNLARLTLNTITNAECRSRHNEVDARRIFDGKICTHTQAAQGTCFGDEGGALISGGSVIGVASWQTPCGVGRPDVYERIADKRLWITSIIS
jgi:trypsin